MPFCPKNLIRAYLSCRGKASLRAFATTPLAGSSRSLGAFQIFPDYSPCLDDARPAWDRERFLVEGIGDRRDISIIVTHFRKPRLATLLTAGEVLLLIPTIDEVLRCMEEGTGPGWKSPGETTKDENRRNSSHGFHAAPPGLWLSIRTGSPDPGAYTNRESTVSASKSPRLRGAGKVRVQRCRHEGVDVGKLAAWALSIS